MKVVIISLCCLVGSTFASDCTWNYGQQGADWGTSGTTGACFDETCDGDRQSPIDIIRNNALEYGGTEVLSFATSYCDSIIGYFKNNGHTLQFDMDNGSGMQAGPDASESYITGGPLGDNKYYFWQFHFHWGSSGNSGVEGSEHIVDGEAFPAEVHLVHVREDYALSGDINGALADPSGLAVLGIFIEGGSSGNATWFDVVSNAAGEIADSGDYNTRVSGIEMNLNDFVHRINPTFNSDFNYWHYEGSLTTIPCSEAVMWLVAEHPVKVTDEQLLEFERLTESDNSTPLVNTYREVQDDNCRKVSYINLNTESQYV